MKITKHINQLWKRTRDVDQNWQKYLCFAVLRVILVFIPQLGYVHPDEFFQSVEVMTGDQFQLEHTRTWEFNNTLPLRSIALPFLLYRVPWSFFEFFAIYVRAYSNIQLLNGYTYLVFPRITICLISFINDWSLYRLCMLYSLRYEIRLLALGSSWIMLVFGTRTFSNTIEMTLCSLLLYLVADCMMRTNTIIYKKEFLEEKYRAAESVVERVKIWKLKNALPEHNFKYALLIATVCVAGVFNRPTFLVFGAPMVFYWLLRGLGSRTVTFKDFNLRIFLFIACAVPSIFTFIFFDSLYYKHLTAGELHMLDIGLGNFIFIPWNFVKYNLDSSKTAQHGVHSRFLHLLVNIPLLYNVLGVIAVVSFVQLMVRFFQAEYKGLPRAQSIIAIMSSAIFVPLFFLSLINHQEARFLIPLIFPIVLMHSPKLVTGFSASYPFKSENTLLHKLYDSVLCKKASARFLLKTWYIFNIALTVFYGFIHQGGVYPLARHFEYTMKNKPMTENIYLVTSHIYNMPLTFVNMPSAELMHYNRETGQRYRRQKDFYLFEYGGMDMQALIGRIRLIASHCEMKLATRRQDYRLFLAIPTSLGDELALHFEKTSMTYMDMELQRIFYPHLSTEAFPSIFGRHPCDVIPPHWSDDDLKGTCSVEKSPELSFSYVSRQFSSFVHQFGLALYEFRVKKSLTRSQDLLETKNI